MGVKSSKLFIWLRLSCETIHQIKLKEKKNERRSQTYRRKRCNYIALGMRFPISIVGHLKITQVKMLASEVS